VESVSRLEEMIALRAALTHLLPVEWEGRQGLGSARTVAAAVYVLEGLWTNPAEAEIVPWSGRQVRSSVLSRSQI
jgi:hypothetical protein